MVRTAAKTRSGLSWPVLQEQLGGKQGTTRGMVTACGIVTVVPGRSVLVVVWVTVPVTVAVVASVISVMVVTGTTPEVMKMVPSGRVVDTVVGDRVVPSVVLTVEPVVVSTVVATVVPTLVRAGMAIVDGNREGRIGMVIFDARDWDVCPVDDCDWVRVGW
jgi:hypothetical protein